MKLKISPQASIVSLFFYKSKESNKFYVYIPECRNELRDKVLPKLHRASQN